MLDPTSPAGIFLIAASVCVVVLTALLSALLVFGIAAALEIRSFARFLKKEAHYIAEERRQALRRIRFAKRWVELFFRRAIHKDSFSR